MMNTMNISGKITLTILLALPFTMHAQQEIEGYWLTQEGNSIVEIYKNSDDKYLGKIVWLKEPNDKKGNALTDKMNKDKSLRGRSVMGMHVLEDLEYAKGVWNGSIYAAKKGRTFSVTLSMDNQDELLVKVSVMGMSRVQNWTRTDWPK
ncbi:MAG: DUF2147 domain-containing protein [Bacteroidota bacterium]